MDRKRRQVFLKKAMILEAVIFLTRQTFWSLQCNEQNVNGQKAFSMGTLP